jgi:uncharacterized membrane protein
MARCPWIADHWYDPLIFTITLAAAIVSVLLIVIAICSLMTGIPFMVIVVWLVTGK